MDLQKVKDTAQDLLLFYENRDDTDKDHFTIIKQPWKS